MKVDYPMGDPGDGCCRLSRTTSSEAITAVLTLLLDSA